MIQHNTKLDYYIREEADQKSVNISKNNIVLYENKKLRELKIDEVEKKFKPYIFRDVELVVMDLENEKVYKITYNYEASSKIDYITNFNIKEIEYKTLKEVYSMIDELFRACMKPCDERIYVDDLNIKIKIREDENVITKISAMINNSYRFSGDEDE